MSDEGFQAILSFSKNIASKWSLCSSVPKYLNAFDTVNESTHGGPQINDVNTLFPPIPSYKMFYHLCTSMALSDPLTLSDSVTLFLSLEST